MKLEERLRRFDDAQWGPKWLRRLADRLRIPNVKKFENDRQQRRFLLGTILVMALVGIAVGVAMGESLSESVRILLTPDAGTWLFVGYVIALNLVGVAMSSWRHRKTGRQSQDEAR